MLGFIEDEARTVAREQPGLTRSDEIIAAVEEHIGWDLNAEATAQDADEAALAVNAYRDEGSQA